MCLGYGWFWWARGLGTIVTMKVLCSDTDVSTVDLSICTTARRGVGGAGKIMIVVLAVSCVVE